MQTSHFPVEAPPWRWLTFRVHPSGRLGSSYIGPLPLPGGLPDEGGGPGDTLWGMQAPMGNGPDGSCPGSHEIEAIQSKEIIDTFNKQRERKEVVRKNLRCWFMACGGPGGLLKSGPPGGAAPPWPGGGAPSCGGPPGPGGGGAGPPCCCGGAIGPCWPGGGTWPGGWNEKGKICWCKSCQDMQLDCW